jgi:hypothetical protein
VLSNTKKKVLIEWLHVVVVYVLRINHMGFVEGGWCLHIFQWLEEDEEKE